jgi:hypothetical protein
MIFTIVDRSVEFYVYQSTGADDMVRITNRLSDYLNEQKLEHKVEWDKLLLFELKIKGKR